MSELQWNASELLSQVDTPTIQDLTQADDILDWVAAFIRCEQFEHALEDFYVEYGPLFQLTQVPEQQQESKWKDAHEKFVQFTQTQIEGFLVEHGFSMKQFWARAEEEIEVVGAKQRHTQKSFFVQLLRACTEYHQFVVMMKHAIDPSYYERKDLFEQAGCLRERIHHSSVDAKTSASLEKELTYLLKSVEENPAYPVDEMKQQLDEIQRKLKQ